MCVMDDKREKRQIIQPNKQASQLDVSLAEPVAYPPGNTVYSSILGLFSNLNGLERM